MQTRNQEGPLSEADRADPAVPAYLRAMAEVQRLKGQLAVARASADAFAARIEATDGDARGRVGRVARELGMGEQSVKNQRQRGMHPRRNAPEVTRPVLTAAQYDVALGRAEVEARHQVPGLDLDAIVQGVLAAVGLLAPPPEPKADGTCTAQSPDLEGRWWQCQKEPHQAGRHDADERHWDDDSDPNAIPARP